MSRTRRIEAGARLALGAGSLALSLVCAELVLRVLLFHVPLVPALRAPELYADFQSDDEFWKLRVRLGAKPAVRDEPLLGYLRAGIERGTYRHEEEPRVGARTPVLLYGDSFAQCAVPAQDCFQGLLNSDAEFARGHYLLNYGVGGYGLDQIYLLYQRTIGRFEKPIVIVSLLDDDIDRCVLRLREGQKPYFELEDGRLKLAPSPIDMDQERFFAAHPPEISSYLFRLLRGQVGLGASGSLDPATPVARKKQAIAAAILRAIATDLKERRLKHVFLVFEGLHRTGKRPLNWRIDFLDALFTELGEPRIWARRVLEERRGAGAFDESAYIVSDRDRHPNRAANALVAQRLLDWLSTGRADGGR